MHQPGGQNSAPKSSNQSMYPDPVNPGMSLNLNNNNNNNGHPVNNPSGFLASPPSNPPSRQDLFGHNGNHQDPSKLNGMFPKQR